MACLEWTTETALSCWVLARRIAERGGLEKIPSLDALEEAIMPARFHRCDRNC